MSNINSVKGTNLAKQLFNLSNNTINEDVYSSDLQSPSPQQILGYFIKNLKLVTNTT